MATEPAVTFNRAAWDLQTLRHRIVDAVYQSEDAEKLRSCYDFLSLSDGQADDGQADTFLHSLPSEPIASAMAYAWREHKEAHTQPLTSVLEEIKEARSWK